MENSDFEQALDPKEKRSVKLLWSVNILLFLAVSATIFGLWYYNTDQSAKPKDTGNGSVLGASTKDPQYLSSLSDSLKTNGFVLYGDIKESKTKKQLAEFGQAAQGLDYVECDSQVEQANPQECLAKGVETYPTWVRGEKKYQGYFSLKELERLIADTVL